jgi:uncharacterized membrane protein
MKKTMTFAFLHFSVATIVAFALTGDFLLGSLIAMIEPSVNTLAFYVHEKVWQKNRFLNALGTSTRIKTISFSLVHFSVAFTVVYMLTGDALAGGIIATIEPAINTVVFYFHEKVWQKKSATPRMVATH